MIKFSTEAVMHKVQKGVGFSGENEEVIRSPSLNCNIATLAKSLWQTSLWMTPDTKELTNLWTSPGCQ
jgi:hypothetical protein